MVLLVNSADEGGRPEFGETHHREHGHRMQRVAIVGAGGAGKTVLANRLGVLLGIAVTHLDALRYTDDWQLVAESEFVACQQEIVTRQQWIIDGNGLASLPVRVGVADTIIVVDPAPLTCLWGILQRRMRYRGGQHPDGVFDRITTEFLRYVGTYRRKHLPKVLDCIATYGRHATLIHLTSRRQANRFLVGQTHRDLGGDR
jgi:adenylate kinase family enzyme